MFGSNHSMAKDGTHVSKQGNHILTSAGENFTRSGSNLYCNGRIVARNCTSDEEAKGIALGMHGGKRW